MLRVVVGGTFEYMHRGHMALLKKAFDVGDFVYIGLTSDRYVKEKKGRKISSYLSRLERLRKEVRMLLLVLRGRRLMTYLGRAAIWEVQLKRW